MSQLLRPPLFRTGMTASIAAFAIYFLLTAAGDLVPTEQIGADFVTTESGLIVRAVVPGGPAARAGLRVGDQVLALDGRPMRNALDWASFFARVEVGEPVPLTLWRVGGLEQSTLVFHYRPGGPWRTAEGVVVVLSRAAQLVTLVFAILLGWRGRSRPARFGFWLLATIAVFSVGLPPRMAVVWRALPLPIEALLVLPSVSKVCIGLIIFLFFQSLLNIRRSPRATAVICLPFALFAVWHLVFLRALLYRPEWLPGLTGYFAVVIAGNLLYVAAALAMIALRYRTLPDPSERRRLRWVVAGSLVGCAAGVPTVAALWLGAWSDPTLIYHSPLGLQLAYTAFLAMPASFWWAISRGQLFDFGFIARRGVQYVFARQALAVITPVVGVSLVLEAAMHREPVVNVLRTHAPLYLAIAATLLLFRRRRAAWLAALDRRLFRGRYDASELLRDVARQVRSARDFRAAAVFVAAKVEAALHPEWAAFFEGSPGDGSVSLVAGRAPTATLPRDGGTSNGDGGAGESSPALVVPVRTGDGGREAILALGPKRSGEPYSLEDRNLLQAITESLGALLDREERALTDAEDAPAPAPTGSSEPRLWRLADAVARGVRVDWEHECEGIVADGDRRALRQLETLARVMETHGAPPDLLAAPGPDGGVGRWGPFTLSARLGEGRSGVVYRAWDPTLERDVAVKLLRPGDIDPVAYLSEARRLARVRHPHVVHVYGAGTEDGTPGFWMELVDGRTLASLVDEEGPLPALEVCGVADAIGRALSAIHRAGLVHQDVKAGNVMREDDGRLVLMDFGAGLASGEGSPRWGTPRYMAPELFEGRPASPGSDIYSLGVLMFFLLTGWFPVDGATMEEIAGAHQRGMRRRIRDIRRDVPDTLVDTIERALARDPADRFASADGLSAAAAGLRPQGT